VPLYRTTPYVFKDTDNAAKLFALAEPGYIYSRINNPTQAILEERFTAMQGGAASLAVSSGTAANFYSIINLAEAGDNFISAANLYGGTFTQFNNILPQFGITCKFVDICNLDQVKAAIDDKTRCIFCETVSNPALEISPLEELSVIAREAGIPLVVDDTFTTPYLCKPFEWGADIVAHSLTKWTGGHGTAVGGIVCDGGKFPWAAGKHPIYTTKDDSYGGLRWGVDLPEPMLPIAYILRMRTVPLRNLGSCMSPDNAWMFMQGIETLALRMERHCENSLKVAEYLSQHDKVEWVRYPGLPGDSQYAKNIKYLKGKGGSLVVFEIKGGKDAGSKFIDSLKMLSHVANVGDAKSLAINPASTTHSQLNEEQQRAAGITPGLVRLSIGIETIDDIIADIEQALAQ